MQTCKECEKMVSDFTFVGDQLLCKSCYCYQDSQVLSYNAIWAGGTQIKKGQIIVNPNDFIA